MRKAAALLALLALSGQARGKCLREIQDPPQDGEVQKGLRIHEWGVFLRDPERIHARAGADTPTFFQKVALPPAPDRDEAPDDCREPVLHIYAPKPMHLDVSVRFPGGKPTIAWPRAETTWLESPNPHPMLSWSLQVGGEEAGAVPPKVPEGHWISACRKAGASILRTPEGKDVERFLLYEGRLAPIEEEVSVGRNAEGFTLRSACVDQAWIVESLPAGLSVLHEKGMVRDPGDNELRRAKPCRPCAPEALRADLAKLLAGAGLSEGESAALLDVWMPELLKPGTRLLHLLPREEYDRILPIAFDPAPEELVRVGLVLQEIQP